MSTDNTKPTLTVAIAQAIIKQFKEKYFDSHVFIQVLMKEYSEIYEDYLAKNNGKFFSANGQVSKFLSDNSDQLNIKRIDDGNIVSVNILGNPSSNALWKKV